MTAKTEVKAARGAGGAEGSLIANVEVEIIGAAGGIAGAEGAEGAEGSLTANVEADVKGAAVGTELEAEAGLIGNTDIELERAEAGAGLIGNIEVDTEAAATEEMGLMENIGLDVEGIGAGG